MSLCATNFAVPLVAVRLNHKSVTKPCDFMITLIKVIFIFVKYTYIYISYKLFLCLTYPKYDLSMYLYCALLKKTAQFFMQIASGM